APGDLMMPSPFSMAAPANAFQLWLVVYVYLLPVLLYTAWASLSIMDMAESRPAPERAWQAVLGIALPLAGGELYLLARAGALSSRARIATVVGGAIVWLVPLLTALWLVGRPLGPKALN